MNKEKYINKLNEELEELKGKELLYFNMRDSVQEARCTNRIFGIQYALNFARLLDEPQKISWRKAISVLEHHFQCEIPRNLDNVVKGYREMSGILNTVEFELSKRNSELTAKEFIFEALESNKQKVKVPKFVADWIEEVKQRGCGLADALDCFASPIMPDNIKEWVEFNSSAIGCHHDHQELLARAWLDGYEVEEEPQYRVIFPNPTEPTFEHCYLTEKGGICYGKCFKSIPKFTEKEIKAMDERYWQFAVSVEKV